MYAHMTELEGRAALDAADAIADAVLTRIIDPEFFLRLGTPGALDRAAEDALFATWMLHDHLTLAVRGNRISVATSDGAVATGTGALSRTVLVPRDLQCTPGMGHGQIAGAIFDGWHHLLMPSRTPGMPEWAYDRSVPVPATLTALEEAFADAISPARTAPPTSSPFRHAVMVNADVVIPPRYGTDACFLVVPDHVRVRVLAGHAGHHEFARP